MLGEHETWQMSFQPESCILMAEKALFKFPESLVMNESSSVFAHETKGMVQHLVIDDMVDHECGNRGPVQDWVDPDGFGLLGVASKPDRAFSGFPSARSPGDPAIDTVLKVVTVQTGKGLLQIIWEDKRSRRINIAKIRNPRTV